MKPKEIKNNIVDKMLKDWSKENYDIDEMDYYFMKTANLSWKSGIEEAEKLIEDIDIELFLTDIRNKKGEKVYCSDEFMKVIQLWWDDKSKELKSKIQELKK